MSTIQYQVKRLSDNVITNMWTSDIDGANRYEPGFGRPQRVVASNDPEIINENIDDALSSAEGEDSLGNEITLYTFAAEFQIIATDITAQLATAKLFQDGLAAQEVGAQAIAQVYVINEQKFALGNLTTQQFQTILNDATLQTIERLLTNGSLQTAKTMIAAYSSPYFSADDIASVIAILNNSGLVS